MSNLNNRNKKVNNKSNNRSRKTLSKKNLLPYLDLYNITDDYPVNKYGLGSAISNAFSSAFSLKGLNDLAKAGIGALGSTAGQLGGGLIAGGKSSGVGSAIGNIGGTLGSAIGAVNPVLGGIVGAGSGLLGGAFNAAFGSKLNKKRIALAENEINAANNFNTNASNFDDLSLLIANSPVIANFSQKDIGSDGWFSNKAKNKYKDLLAQKEFADSWVSRSIENNANNILLQQMNNLLLNYAAYGGPLNKYAIGGDKTPWYQPFLEGLWGATYDSRGNYKGNALFKKTPKKGTFGGGSFEGAGASGSFPIINDYSSLTFNEAFDKAYKNKEKEFKYGEKYYNTEKETNPIREVNNRFVGNSKDRAKLKATDNYQYTVGPVNLYGLETVPFVELSPFAYGGLLDMNNQYSDGGKIYIKPENRGKFTALKERTGKSATWFKEHGTPAQKKMATFALNSRKWKHEDGGPLSTHGLDLSNGVIEINNGGTHEENPMEGILMGIDNQGIPNLVEEGEVVFNDYVFSNRLNVPKAVREKYKLRGNKELTFADAAKQMLKESEERPNDPISKKGLTSSMSILQQAQEDVRLKKQQNKENRSNKFKKGGNLVSTDILNDPRWKTVPKLPDNFNSNPFLDKKISESIVLTDELNKGIKSYKKDLLSYFSKDDIATPWLRYAPAFGSALGVGYNLLSKPDYSRADALAQFAQNAGKVTPISYEPIGNYLTYRPTDLSYQANRMAALAGATRRNIMNTSGGNRANAIGSLLAADYNNQIAMGEAIRQAEATNFARRAQVEEFNRGTNLYNSEAALKAAIANQQARLDASRLGLSGYATAMQMKDAIDAQRARTLSANLTNLFESLGQIGEEQYDKNRLKWLERKGVLRSDYFDTGKYNNGRS